LAPQLKRKAVNRPNAEANLLGNLHDACSLPKLGTGAFKGVRVIEWPAMIRAMPWGTPLKRPMRFGRTSFDGSIGSPSGRYEGAQSKYPRCANQVPR
jgi:hypothetical protein